MARKKAVQKAAKKKPAKVTIKITPELLGVLQRGMVRHEKASIEDLIWAALHRWPLPEVIEFNR